LTTIVDGTQIVAVDHRNNYASVQTGVNGLIAALSGGTAGQYLTATSPSAIAWAAPPGITAYRKTTAKTINASTTETDLLNGEISIAAGVMGTGGVATLVAWGDLLNNNATSLNSPRWKLKLGGTTLIDSNIFGGNVWTQSAARWGWRVCCEIMNLGSAGAQIATIDMRYTLPALAGAGPVAFTIGNGNHGGTGGYAVVIGNNTGAVDTTASKLLEFTVTLPVLAATMECKLYGALVTVL